MIPVQAPPEPVGFRQAVHTPGRAYLAQVRRPTTAQYKTHDYWTRCIPDLYKAFGGVCSFSCHWIPRGEGSVTVEHFKPKSLYPQLAYEWKNYRLMCGTLNGRKKNYQDVLDPIGLEPGLFRIEFPALLVKPGDGLSVSKRRRVQATIDRLRLNDDGTCLHSRNDWLRSYCVEGVPFTFLKAKAPFLAGELERQGLVTTIRGMMNYPTPVT